MEACHLGEDLVEGRVDEVGELDFGEWPPSGSGWGSAAWSCGGRAWQVLRRPKNRLRRLLELAIAAPDVFIFQSDSGGWPSRAAEWWTCLNCGRRVRR